MLVLEGGEVRTLVSDEHFSLPWSEGTAISPMEAWGPSAYLRLTALLLDQLLHHQGQALEDTVEIPCPGHTAYPCKHGHREVGGGMSQRGAFSCEDLHSMCVYDHPVLCTRMEGVHVPGTSEGVEALGKRRIAGLAGRH
jgi:hypothetical protein